MNLRALLRQIRLPRPRQRAVREWWRQRLSAVLLTPLSLWFVFSLAALPSWEYPVMREWVAAPTTAALLLVFLPCLFYHAQAGLQVILEDYLHAEWEQILAAAMVVLFAIMICGSAMFAVLGVCFGFRGVW